ncbi:MAG TPA: DUF6526 family protein [Chitinophagaceae bacterium]|nr:DUF6526 family protein [Chitinophagaceae bacterium]
MNSQNYKNHSRYIPLWHLIVPIIMVGLIGGAIYNLIKADDSALYSAALILLIVLLLPVFYWYTRSFALRAQDRAIRAEENFRHFLLTGRPLDPKLRMGQIIALRFASDEEMPGLARKAVDEKLSQSQVKKEIKNWRGDYRRV